MPGLEGTSLGRYHLTRRLGRGGMAEVYLANDERMHRAVAIKIVSTSHTEFAERFSRETEAMGNLHHDHILSAYDYGEQEPWHYLVMPYIAHGTLSELLKKGQLSLEHAGELLQQVASALQYAHRRGLIHRDIKPSNILLRDDHYAYLADFGLARVLERGRDLTVTGTLLGTPEYMAPELAESSAGVSSDVYALAVVLYEMISGRVPFQGETALSIFWKHVRDYPHAPSRYNPAIPKAVDRVLMRALEKDPERRYPTPQALSQAYQEALTDAEGTSSLHETEIMEETPAYPVPPPERPQQKQIILPGGEAALPPPVLKRPHPPVTPASVAGPKAGRTTDPFALGATTLSPRPPVARPRRSRSSGAGMGIVIGLLFLLIVSGFLAYLTIQSRQHNALVATATARAEATNSVLAQQTLQAQNAQQTATAISAAATAQAQATQQAIQATVTAVVSGTPLLSDPLSGPDDNGWPNDGSSCAFTNSRYYVTATGVNTLQPCIAAASTVHYDKAAFQVTMTLISSEDAGLIFRVSADGNQFYDFELNNQGQFLLRYRNNNKYTNLVEPTASSAIQKAGGENTLLVIANGPNFELFINGTFVGSTHDSTFTSGQLGLVAGTLSSNSGDASFTNLVVYPVG